MIPEGNVQANLERFTGFADIYDAVRPTAPTKAATLITRYLGRDPALVVDVGCGTGLSTLLWHGYADRVVGVEPNPSMRSVATTKLTDLQRASVSFVEGFSNQVPLDADTADVVTCSQSFHWMEPQSTLREVNRLLKPGGVFATYDCDWPPSLHADVEMAYLHLMDVVDRLSDRLAQPEQVTKWPKENHLNNIKASGVFRYARELIFDSWEPCDAERFIGIALSQGGLQAVLRAGMIEVEAPLEQFQSAVNDYFIGRTLDVMLGYRMRLGVK